MSQTYSLGLFNLISFNPIRSNPYRVKEDNACKMTEEEWIDEYNIVMPFTCHVLGLPSINQSAKNAKHSLDIRTKKRTSSELELTSQLDCHLDGWIHSFIPPASNG
eukprot:709529_1